MPRDDLRGFSGGRKPGRFRQCRFPTLGAQSNLPAATELPAAGVLAADPAGIMKSSVSRNSRIRLDRDSYQRLRQRVLHRDRWRWQRCGSSKDLQVHRIQQRSRLGGDAEENLIALCSVCRREIHLRGEVLVRFDL